MSAAFEFGDYLCWDTNGMIEEYLDQMARTAAETFGTENKLAQRLYYQHQSFYPGAVIFLDDILIDEKIVTQFTALLDKTTHEFLEGDQFNEIGRRWLHEEVPKLKAHILGHQ